MADKTDHTAAESVTSAINERIVEPMKHAGEAMKASGAKIAENSAAMSLKMLDHAEQNTREAFAAMRAAAQSQSVTDVLKVQGDFIREQGGRSMTHAREIGELIAAFGKTVVSPLTEKKD